jgi:hypothetical protein
LSPPIKLKQTPLTPLWEREREREETGKREGEKLFFFNVDSSAGNQEGEC